MQIFVNNKEGGTGRALGFCVTYEYKTYFGLDDWIYCTLYIYTFRDYRQYSSIAILHTSQVTVKHAPWFSAFTCRIPATDLSQSHCNFSSLVKFSLHCLIHFLPLFWDCKFLRLDCIQFQAHIPAGWSLEARPYTSDSTTLLLLLCLYYFCPAKHFL
jgi:hypothetical protein